jgi:hypothetical protein
MSTVSSCWRRRKSENGLTPRDSEAYDTCEPKGRAPLPAAASFCAAAM